MMPTINDRRQGWRLARFSLLSDVLISILQAIVVAAAMGAALVCIDRQAPPSPPEDFHGLQ